MFLSKKNRLKGRWLSNIINKNRSVFCLFIPSLAYFCFIYFNLISSLMKKIVELLLSIPKEEEKIVSIKKSFNSEPS